MENFSIKSCFIFDSTLKSKKKKPSDDEIQDVKLLYYYPNKEDQVIKRSNMGIVEGTMDFMDAFEKSEEDGKFLISELSKCYYIANRFEGTKTIALILQKTANSEFTVHQNIDVKKKWFKVLLKNFYEMYILYHGLIKEVFFPKGEDQREKADSYKQICEVTNDFLENYFEALNSNKIPFLDNILYFPLNESSHSQLLLAAQRLTEKFPDVKYTSLMYKGYLLHNEAPLESVSLLYNSFFNNIDASPKYYNFSRPPYKVVQTINSGIENEHEAIINTSQFRKCFELIGLSNYLVGINRLNINNFHVFIPTIYFKSTNEKLKLLVFYQNGLLLFLFLNENFNPATKISSLIKLERWATRYFDEEIPGLESLYQQKMAKADTVTFAYVNNFNKSIKLSSSFFNKKSKSIEKDKVDFLMQMLKVNYNTGFSSLMKIRGFYVYYLVTCERKVIVLLPESLNITQVKSSIEEIKKDLFDYIFIL